MNFYVPLLFFFIILFVVDGKRNLEWIFTELFRRYKISLANEKAWLLRIRNVDVETDMHKLYEFSTFEFLFALILALCLGMIL